MDNDDGWCDSVEYEQEELENFELDEDYYPRRPECYFILGVVSSLEPSVRSLLAFMGNLTTNSEKLVRALGLDFDPELEFKKTIATRKNCIRIYRHKFRKENIT
jgi:hypothetical protein